MIELVSFGEAIKALNNGLRVQREGWNGKGLFVFRQVPAEISHAIVPKMQSLPQTVKDEFVKRYNESSSTNSLEHLSIRYKDQLALVNPNNTISGWSPSTNDALAEDWVILN